MRWPGRRSGHVFISYVREDSARVDRLQAELESEGFRVWRDTEKLWPGEDWKAKIRGAIIDDALAFIACFSLASISRARSYQNEELALAIEELRRRRPEDMWLFPVRLDDCDIPDLDLGGGRTLGSIQRADLFGDRYEQDAGRLAGSIRRILGRPPAGRTRALTGSGALVVAVVVAFAVIHALAGTGGVPSSPGSAPSSPRSAPETPAAVTAHLYSASAYKFRGPSAVAVAGGHVWVANEYGNSVTELDERDGSLIQNLSAAAYGFDGPDAIAVAGGHVWVANPLNDSGTELNAGSGTLIKNLTRGDSFGPSDAIAVYGGHVWVAESLTVMTELNASSGRLIKKLSASGNYNENSFDGPDLIAADGTHLWVADAGADTVTELDASDGRVVQNMYGTGYGFEGPGGIVADGTHVWVANSSGYSVTELDESDGSLVKVLPPVPYGFSGPDAIAADGTHVWVANRGSDSVTEVDERDGSFVRTFSAASYGFSGPDAIAADGSSIWVANQYGNSVTELPA